MAKHTVIERLRAAEQWLAKLPGHSGEPFGWLRTLVYDAMQELQSESGALWMQTMTGPQSHVRIFVAGELGPREMDLLLEMLRLTRSYMREEAAPANAGATPLAEGVTDERAKSSSSESGK